MTSQFLTYALIALFVSGSAIADAAEIKVIGGSAVIPAMAELIPKFEQSSGHKVRADFDGAIGQIADRIRKGELADVAILSGAQINALTRDGMVVAASRRDLAKVGVGAFVRQGEQKPDIGSVEAFTRLLSAAKSIGYNDPAAGAPVSLYLLELFEHLGMAGKLNSKT